jgi:hypothetical protein
MLQITNASNLQLKQPSVFVRSVLQLLDTANVPSSSILSPLMMEAIDLEN